MVKIATTLFSYPWQGFYITSSCISSIFFFLILANFYSSFHIKKIRFWFVVYFRPSSFSQVNRSFINDDLSLIPGLGRSPGRGHGNPLQYSCLENLHGQASLVRLQSMGSRYPERSKGWGQRGTSPNPAGQRTSASGLKTQWFLFHLPLVAMGLIFLYPQPPLIPLPRSQSCHVKGAYITQWSYEPSLEGSPKTDGS